MRVACTLAVGIRSVLVTTLDIMAWGMSLWLTGVRERRRRRHMNGGTGALWDLSGERRERQIEVSFGIQYVCVQCYCEGKARLYAE